MLDKRAVNWISLHDLRLTYELCMFEFFRTHQFRMHTGAKSGFLQLPSWKTTRICRWTDFRVETWVDTKHMSRKVDEQLSNELFIDFLDFVMVSWYVCGVEVLLRAYIGDQPSL